MNSLADWLLRSAVNSTMCTRDAANPALVFGLDSKDVYSEKPYITSRSATTKSFKLTTDTPVEATTTTTTTAATTTVATTTTAATTTATTATTATTMTATTATTATTRTATAAATTPEPLGNAAELLLLLELEKEAKETVNAACWVVVDNGVGCYDDDNNDNNDKPPENLH